MSAGRSQHHDSSPRSDHGASTSANSGAEVFRVAQMDCSEEVAAVERAVAALPGVVGLRAEIVASKVTVWHDGKLSRSVIAEAINKSGVTVQDEKERDSHPSAGTILVATSGIATGLGLLLQWLGFKDGWQPDAAFLVAIMAGGWLVVPKAVRSLRSLSLDMNVLMTVAVLGAVAIGEQAEGAAVAFLFSLSELLESWSVGRARRAIEALMETRPGDCPRKAERRVARGRGHRSATRRNLPREAGSKSAARR
jgi:Cd2+/Zn2+-exporting ATPase